MPVFEILTNSGRYLEFTHFVIAVTNNLSPVRGGSAMSEIGQFF